MISQLIKKSVLFVLIFQIAVMPFQSDSFAMAKKNKTEYKSNKCGEFNTLADLDAYQEPQVCVKDEGTLKKRYQTFHAVTEIRVPEELIDISRNASEVVDRVLLDEIRDLAIKKYDDQFAGLLSIPEPTERDFLPPKTPHDKDKLDKDLKEAKEQVRFIKDGVRDLKEYVFDEKGKPIHQIRKLLTLYPDLEENLLKDHPEYAPLICKYEVWKHKAEVLAKVSKILGPIITVAAVIAIPLTGGLAIPALAGVMIGFGSAEIAMGSIQIASAAANWDDVKAGNAAKRFLALDLELEKYLNDLQKKKINTEQELKDIQILKAALFSKKDLEDLKNIKKLKRKRVLELVGGGFKVLMGAATIYGGTVVSQYFSGFKANTPAKVVENPGGNGTIPGSGGNDGPGGVMVDDGG